MSAEIIPFPTCASSGEAAEPSPDHGEAPHDPGKSRVQRVEELALLTIAVAGSVALWGAQFYGLAKLIFTDL